ncbi:homoserine kinase [Candidatus Micrarchaeota archaeon]|nr:homoserine kinase [Candidatus Micrarchaeota archaeon]
MDSISIRAPATTANLGAGFDVCGMALSEPFDEFTFSKSDAWHAANETAFIAATDEQKSVFGFVWNAMKQEFGLPGSLQISAKKGIQPSAGMGSSAAEASATAFAVNELFGLNLERSELVHWAGLGEGFTAGNPHYDNVAPCVLGGFTITYNTNPLKVKRLDAPKDLVCMLVVSEVTKPSTAFARSVLPEQVPRRDALVNCQYLSRLLVGFYENDVQTIVSGFGDAIVEPSRARAGGLPNFLQFKKLGDQHGFGTASSGAGPTLIAFGAEESPAFSDAVLDSFSRKGIRAKTIWTKPSALGVHAL